MINNRLTIIPARVNPVVGHPAEQRVSLSGVWRFRLDPDEEGLRRRWYARPDHIRERIRVPGCWQGQGFGGKGQDTVWDFRLDARTLRATYTGTGWYARVFRVPAEMKGRRLWLNFGGVFPSADFWLNGVKLGTSHEPFVPCAFEITDDARYSEDNDLVVRVHEQYRELGFAFSFQGNWSGLYRDVELNATGAQYLAGMQSAADADTGKVTVQAVTGGLTAGMPLKMRVMVTRLDGKGAPVSVLSAVEKGITSVSVVVPEFVRWSPDAPNLYRLDTVLQQGDRVLDARSERVGFVKLDTCDKHFLINGEPYYMRGTGEFLSNPETACPDTSRERWRKKLKVLRAYGYNYVRCQSFVPAPEYYDVADEVGLLVQSEMGMIGAWGSHTQWHVYAWPPPTPAYYERLKTQWDRVVLRDQHHPSANLYCMSNELGGGTHFPRMAWQCYRDTKAVKPTALVIWTDGGHSEALPEDFVNAEADQDAKCAKPLIQHEYRWWSSFPDVRIRHKYSGAVRPYAAEMARVAARQHGLLHVLPRAAATSQRLQFLESKGKMEICRRDNPRLAGICHFNAMDANPSPQGIVDEFYDKKYATAAQWQQTNGDTVVLLGAGFEDRVHVGGECIRHDISVSDFSHPPFVRPVLEWEVWAGSRRAQAGRVSYTHVPYITCKAGTLEWIMPELTRPQRIKLLARLREGGRTVTNQWDFWSFPRRGMGAERAVHGKAEHTWLKTLPAQTVCEARVLLTERLDESLLAALRAGQRVVLAASEGLVRPFNPKFGFTLGQYFFTPPANYPPYEDGHDGTIVLSHPMLGDFPHEGFADLQFFRMISPAPPVDLEPLGLNNDDPVIRVMHSFPVGRSLGYLLERAVGKGRLIICALHLDQNWPEARYLLDRICRYAAGARMAPARSLAAADLARIQRITALA